jgi:hypothetical protein
MTTAAIYARRSVEQVGITTRLTRNMADWTGGLASRPDSGAI